MNEHGDTCSDARPRLHVCWLHMYKSAKATYMSSYILTYITQWHIQVYFSEHIHEIYVHICTISSHISPPVLTA